MGRHSPILFMARKVKCQLTGEWGTSDTFFKAENGLYYKSEQLYNDWQRKKKARTAAIDFFCVRFLGYEPGSVFPTWLTKKFKEYEDRYGFEKLLLCLKQQAGYIEYAISRKDFGGDTRWKINYIFAIINNYINDTRETPATPVRHQISEPEPIAELRQTQTTKDMRGWLDDEPDT